MRQYIFGPVPSRRLGISLGVDLTPGKTCSYDCIYCQLSKTQNHGIERSRLCPPEDVLAELKEVLGEIAPPDWITFSGTGEPTLHTDLGYIISELKEFCPAPVCVITNASLIFRADVQTDLLQADRILPTLTSVNQATYEKIHRPAAGLDLPLILKGLRDFSSQFPGAIEVEIFVLPGINDSHEEIEGLKKYLASLPNLNAVYLNTAVRMPLDSKVKTADHLRLEEFKQQLDLKVPVSTAFERNMVPPRPAKWNRSANLSDVFNLLLRHPCHESQLTQVLGCEKSVISKLLKELAMQGKVKRQENGEWRLLDLENMFR
jgi:wyosine [tRNA(Phe)-imidazoG37] synthetase (radical SAM superfamily)